MECVKSMGPRDRQNGLDGNCKVRTTYTNLAGDHANANTAYRQYEYSKV